MKVLKRLIIFLGILFLFLCIGVLLYWIDVKLDAPTNAELTKLELETADDSLRKVSNGSWLKKNKYGIWEMFLTGDPSELGVAFGTLGKPLMKEKEAAFIQSIKDRIPSESYLNSLKYYVGWFNRDLDEYVQEEYLQEIYTASQYMSDEYDFIAEKYHRSLSYHAAHDIGHALQNMNLVGCTAFAVRNSNSENDKLLIGRNFDFYFGNDFAKDRILAFYKPTNGYKFASVTWAGFSGVVSGLNETGLCVTLNSAKSDIPSKGKTPVSIIAREILQYASTIEEAFEIASKRESFVAEMFLIGSVDGRVAVIEKSTNNTVLLESDKDQFVLTNHFQSEALKDSELNRTYLNEGVSQYRQERVNQLINALKPLNPRKAASILRDTKGLSEEDIGFGNEKSINQLIAHHGVMFSPEEKLIFLAAEPFQLGTFVAYDLDAVFSKAGHSEPLYVDSLVVEEDSFINTETYMEYQFFLETKNKIQSALFKGVPDKELTDKFLIEFQKSNPNSFLTYYYLGDYYLLLNKYDLAIEAFTKGLELEIARTSERMYMEERLNTAIKESN